MREPSRDSCKAQSSFVPLDTDTCRGSRCVREDRRNRRTAQRTPHHFVGDDVDVLLPIAVGIDATILSGDARERSICNQRGEFDCSGGNGLDHRTNRDAMRDLRNRSIKM